MWCVVKVKTKILQDQKQACTAYYDSIVSIMTVLSVFCQYCVSIGSTICQYNVNIMSVLSVLCKYYVNNVSVL